MVHPEIVAEVNAGGGASLTCVAYGEPTVPSITWSRNSGDLSNDSRITVLEEIVAEGGVRFAKSTLKICRNDDTDEDVYDCIATAGTAIDTFRFHFIQSTTQGM